MRIQTIPLVASLLAFALTRPVAAQVLEKPADIYYAKYHPLAPLPVEENFLKTGDRLAICGDSITEQKRYSRIMETYLTVCQPDLNITVRQYGWSGEKASGFLHRMTNDCLRFHPTVATTCYGMNDHEYRAYEDRIGLSYRENMLGVVQTFKANGVRVILGCAGSIGKKPTWVGDPNANIQDMNLNLGELRNIDIKLARQEQVGFADVFWPMLTAGHDMEAQYGTNFAVSGKDGVHPDWAGHVMMAYAFLHSFGLDGNLGTFTVDMKSGKASVSTGHELISSKDGELEIKSSRYPFCIGDGDPARDNNIRAGTFLVPFNQELNRLTLIVKNAESKNFSVIWGARAKSFNAEQLSKGINLAEEFPVNPFTESFRKVDAAVAKKQEFETQQIQKFFHGKEGKADMESTVKKTEAERDPLAAAIKTAFVPVTHTIRIAVD